MTESMSEVYFERLKIVAVEYITKELAEQFALAPEVDFSLHTKFMANEIAMRVVQCVYGRDYEVATAAYPADWWQAFRDRWFPEWAKQRWPIQEKTISIRARELYPDVVMPDERRIVQVRTVEDWGRTDEIEIW